MRIFQTCRAALVGCVLACLLSACGNKSENQTASSSGSGIDAEHPLPSPPMVAPCEPGRRGGRLVIATFGEPKTFNPITANETSSTDIILRINGSLVNVDSPTQEVLPGMAESWSVEPDN